MLLAFLTALIYRVLTKPSEMQRVKKDMNELRDKVSKAQKAGDTKEASRLMTETLKANQAVFRMNMKPMMASMLLFLLAVGWLAARFEAMSIAAPFYIPFIGASFNWFWWYLIVVLAGNFVFRKLLGVE